MYSTNEVYMITIKVFQQTVAKIGNHFRQCLDLNIISMSDQEITNGCNEIDFF